VFGALVRSKVKSKKPVGVSTQPTGGGGAPGNGAARAEISYRNRPYLRSAAGSRHHAKSQASDPDRAIAAAAARPNRAANH
jgi:hypothetical protein